MASSSLIKEQSFQPFFWTQFLGAFNDNIFKNALIILITFKNIHIVNMGSELLVPLAAGVFILPFFLFSATAGQISDRYDKSTIIRLTKISELIIMVISLFGLYFDNYILLLFTLFLMGTQSTFFGPLKYGIIPSIVGKEKIVEATGFISTSTFISILVGTILGGFFVMKEPLLLGVILCFVSCLGIYSSRQIKRIAPADLSIKVDYTFLKPTIEIIKQSCRDKEVFKLILGISWFWFLGAGILSLVPLFVRDVLMSNNEVATVFLAIFTIGMGIGAFLTKILSGESSEVGIIALSALLLSFFMIDLYFVSQNLASAGTLNIIDSFKCFSTWRAAIDLLFISIFGGCYIVPQMSFLQEVSALKVLSRNIAANNIWNAFFMVLASLLVMFLSTLGPAYSFFIFGILAFFSSFILYAFYSLPSVRFLGELIVKAFYKFKLEGEGNLPKSGPFIIASNHISFIDWLFLYAAIRPPVQFVIDYNYYYKPMAPFWLKQAKLIPIATKRESEEVLKQAFAQIRNELDNGAVLGIFPEGWISRDGKTRTFQPGINKILKQNPVDVIPVVINGAWGSIFSYKGGKVLLKWPKYFRKKITVKILPKIKAENFSRSELQQIIENKVTID